MISSFLSPKIIQFLLFYLKKKWISIVGIIVNIINERMNYGTVIKGWS